jgi:hypothetical protein
MLFLSGLFFVTVFPLVEAIVPFTALQTLVLAPPDPALSGWTPRPTTPSEAKLFRRLLEGRQLKTTCAYSNGVPLTCPLNEYCGYDYTQAAVACCSVDGNSNLLADCAVPTECLNQAESSLYCPASRCPVGTAVW